MSSPTSGPGSLEAVRIAGMGRETDAIRRRRRSEPPPKKRLRSIILAGMPQAKIVEGKSMSEAVIAQKAPYAKELEAGKTYYWCACGRVRQPAVLRWRRTRPSAWRPRPSPPRRRERFISAAASIRRMRPTATGPTRACELGAPGARSWRRCTARSAPAFTSRAAPSAAATRRRSVSIIANLLAVSAW